MRASISSSDSNGTIATSAAWRLRKALRTLAADQASTTRATVARWRCTEWAAFRAFSSCSVTALVTESTTGSGSAADRVASRISSWFWR
jgi:hypothetical protein